MYEVKIINESTEITIHYPTPDTGAPHVNNLPLKEGLSSSDSLSFNLYTNNPGYNLIYELSTKVKVIDTRDNTVRFTGRILDISEHMDSDGLIYKSVTCEGALSFLTDTKQRSNTFMTTTPTEFLTQLLAIHNNKVDVSRQIQVGTVDVTGSVAYTCNFKTTLAELLAVKELIGGDIQIREVSGVLYLDWVQMLSSNTVSVILGENMKSMVKAKDVTSLGTRIIPLGSNNLTISDVNNGVDYIDDSDAIATFGVIEKIVEYRDIEDATVLKNTCLADLSNYTQPLYLLECEALDLSYITGNKIEQFTIGTDLHIYNSIMGIDSIYKIVQIDLDLLSAYNPKLTIANFPVKISNTINDLRQTTIQNDGVYYGVQIGDSFGIKVMKSDSLDGLILNSDEISFYKNGVEIGSQLTRISADGIYTGVVEANQLLIGGEYGSITAEDVGARPYDWNPQYTDILGTKPPENADNTQAFVGNKFTYVDANGIYTGILSADQINGGTITGITLQTGWGGKRVVISGNELSGQDANGYKRVAFLPDSSDFNYSIEFRDANNTVCGDIYANEGNLAIRNPYCNIDITPALAGNLWGTWYYAGNEILTAANYVNPNVASYGDFIYFTTTTTSVALYKSGDSTPYLSLSSAGYFYVHGNYHPAT